MRKLFVLLAAFILITSYTKQPPFLQAQIINQESALVSWTPPTTREDGSALTNLSHYHIYYDVGTSEPADLARQEEVGGNLSSYKIDGLGPGMWCFAMTAIDSDGLESDFSNVACKTIEDFEEEPASPPKAPGALAVQ